MIDVNNNDNNNIVMLIMMITMMYLHMITIDLKENILRSKKFTKTLEEKCQMNEILHKNADIIDEDSENYVMIQIITVVLFIRTWFK